VAGARLSDAPLIFERRRDDTYCVMSVHLICPSLKCRKILTMSDDVRGALVNCRYCGMQFRVPRPNRPHMAVPAVVNGSATPASASPSCRDPHAPIPSAFGQPGSSA
jgi:hypothetical protein